jgi:hypothetical protein
MFSIACTRFSLPHLSAEGNGNAGLRSVMIAAGRPTSGCGNVTPAAADGVFPLATRYR